MIIYNSTKEMVEQLTSRVVVSDPNRRFVQISLSQTPYKPFFQKYIYILLGPYIEKHICKFYKYIYVDEFATKYLNQTPNFPYQTVFRRRNFSHRSNEKDNESTCLYTWTCLQTVVLCLSTIIGGVLSTSIVYTNSEESTALYI